MRNWHQSTRLATALFITAGCVVNLGSARAFAAESSVKPIKSITEAQALAIVKRTFAIPSSYTMQNENYNQGQTGAGSYNFSFQAQNSVNSINVTVDAGTGAILNYYRNSPTQEGFSFPAPVSQAQAQIIALRWAKKLYPNLLPNVKSVPPSPQSQSLTTPTMYTFNFERVIGGIPAPFDGFTIVIDQNGNLSSASESWAAQGLPSVHAKISDPEAQQIYQKSLQLQLAYVQSYGSPGVSQNILAYAPTQQEQNQYYGSGSFGGNQTIEAPVIDATTGSLLNSNGNSYSMTPHTAPQPLVAGGPAWSATRPNVNWTHAETLAFAEHALAVLGYSQKTLKLTNSSENSGSGNDDSWSFNWSAPKGVHVNMNIDATYGYISGFNQFSSAMKMQLVRHNAAHKPKYTEAQALAVAKKELAVLYPSNTGGLSIVPQPNQNTKFGNAWGFNITSLVNGIPYQANFGSINVNWTTGQVQGLNWNYTPSTSTLPLPTNAVPVAKAQAAWQNLAKLQLEYMQFDSGKTPETKLVYAPVLPTGNNLTLDAVTGKFLFAGYPKNSLPHSGPLTDIQGVPGATQLQVLADRDLIQVSPTGSVDPTQTVTLADFLQLLTSSFAQNNPNVYTFGNGGAGLTLPSALSKLLAQVPSTNSQEQQAIGTAYQLGWLPSGPLNVNAPLTRMLAAEILVRVLDLYPLLSHPQGLTLTASDTSAIPQDGYTAAALSVSLGLLPLQNGAFDPSSSMNLSDEAIAVVATANVFSQMHLYSYANNGMGAMG